MKYLLVLAFPYLCPEVLCVVGGDCLNPLLSNKSLCGVKFEYVTAAGQGRHFDAFVTECFVFLPVRPRVSDFRGPTHADRGLGGPTRPRGRSGDL